MIKNIIKLFFISQLAILITIYLKFNLVLDKEKFAEEYIKWLGGSLVMLLTHGVSMWREYAERKKAEKLLYDKVKLKISVIEFSGIENAILKIGTHDKNYAEHRAKEIILLDLKKINSELVSIVNFIEQYCMKHNIFYVEIYNKLIKITSEIKRIVESKKIEIDNTVSILNELKKIIN